MSKRKYTIGRPIRTVGEFESSDSKFFVVQFGRTWKTLHRGFLDSWQFHTLQVFCNNGNVYTAEEIKSDE